MARFRLAPDASRHGTGFLKELNLVPSALVRCFGAPGQSDPDKVSGEYVFEDENGNVFTLYDWKCTSIWELAEGYAESPDEVTLPTPKEFWALNEPVRLHIGGVQGRGEVADFIDWIKRETSAEWN